MAKAKKKVQWIEKTRKIYYDPIKPGSYSGIQGLRRVTGYKTKKIKEWLSGQDTYTLHKSVRWKYPRRKVIVPGIDYQWQADLVDLSSIKNENKGHTFLLTVIDVFSKRASCEPLMSKSGECVLKAFKNILKQRNMPKKLQTDKGSEFYNKKVQALLKKNSIDLFSTENDDIKACIVERFNRTLKTRMWKYFTAEKTKRYLDVLADLIDGYNNTFHSSIKMTPNQVNKDNEHHVWNTLYGKRQKSGKPKLKVGDIVRISKTRRTFKKGYLPNWSDELFTVAVVKRTNPGTYHNKEENGDLVKG